MKFEPIKQFSDENFDDSVSTREVLEKYIIHWKWFVFSVLFFLALGFVKVYHEVPKYKINASLLIKEQEKGNSFVDLSEFENLGLFGSGAEKSLENEIQILKSRRLMTKVVEELKLNIAYFIENYPYDTEVYPDFPVSINFQNDSLSIHQMATEFKVRIQSEEQFEFINYDGVSSGNKTFGEYFLADLGNEELEDKRTIQIQKNDNFSKDLIGETVRISIRPLRGVVNDYITKIVIEPVNEKLSKVLTITLEDYVRQKGIALVNNLIEQYNADGIQDKNLVTQFTTDFLDERLALLSTELNAIESTAEQFKTKNRMMDVNDGTNIYLQSSSANESDLVAANTQLSMVNYMLEELNNSGNEAPLPGNIGLDEPAIVAMISDYNNLILQRNRILKSSSTKNPIIVNIDSQLAVLKNNLRSSLNNQKSSAQIQISALNNQSNRIGSRIASVPRNEREYKDIVRTQETKNALYLFLLQKREESILSNAVNVEKAKIIDIAYSSPLPVSPKKEIAFLVSIFLGLVIPAGVIYLKEILDTKVHNEKDVQKLRIPYLGDVPLTNTKKDLYISDMDNSSIAESFRYIRTNINFMLDSKEAGKTVFITSTQSGEGKTFTAINLASSLAISGKKTLLLGMDLRAPKINTYLGLKNLPGVSNFITNEALTLQSIIESKTKFANLHVVNSGDIPPNPVELLMSKRVNEIFEAVKKYYDYIIVDTAPVGMVSDTIQISKFADMTIYVVKANSLDKRMLHIPEKLHKEQKLHNMAILINCSDHHKGAYGYGYGYGNKMKKPWYHKMFQASLV